MQKNTDTHRQRDRQTDRQTENKQFLNNISQISILGKITGDKEGKGEIRGDKVRLEDIR